jgi:hypothetical protein
MGGDIRRLTLDELATESAAPIALLERLVELGQVGDRTRLEPAGSMALKGIAEPVALWSVDVVGADAAGRSEPPS